MNNVEFRQDGIRLYQSYVSSFVLIRDRAIQAYVVGQRQSGVFWPDPLAHLNSNSTPCRSVAERMSEGLLHPQCAELFAAGNPSLDLDAHQHATVRLAREGWLYMFTTPAVRADR